MKKIFKILNNNIITQLFLFLIFSLTGCASNFKNVTNSPDVWRLNSFTEYELALKNNSTNMTVVFTASDTSDFCTVAVFMADDYIDYINKPDAHLPVWIGSFHHLSDNSYHTSQIKKNSGNFYNSSIEGIFVVDTVSASGFTITTVSPDLEGAWKYNRTSKEGRQSEVVQKTSLSVVEDNEQLTNWSIFDNYDDILETAKQISTPVDDISYKKYKNGVIVKFADGTICYLTEDDKSLFLIGFKDNSKFLMGKFSQDTFISKWQTDDTTMSTYYKLKPFDCYSIFTKNSESVKVSFLPYANRKLNIESIQRIHDQSGCRNTILR